MTAIQPDIYNLSLRMLWNPDEAKDCTQDILIRILGSISSFQGHSSFKTWYYRVASNHLLNHKIKQDKRAAATLSFDALGALLNENLSEPVVASDLERKIMAEEVKIGCSLGMLQCLDNGGRLVYILGEIIGINSIQGAVIMNISSENFRQQLARARKKITAFAGQYCGLVNTAAACSCNKAINRAVQSGMVNTQQLRYAHDGESLQLLQKLDRIVDKTKQLFTTIPRYNTPAATLDTIRAILIKEKM